jgi:FkbM family methyltransferase
MKFSFEHGGETFEFECFDNQLSRRVCNHVLQGQTYPALPFVSDVTMIIDVGAYVGASSLYFSLQHPEAQIFAFEPATAAYRLLEKNTRHRSNVHTHNFGLFSSDKTVPLYKGTIDDATASVSKSAMTSEESEIVRLRSLREWLREHAISAVDVLKLDTEGCEVPILHSMSEFLPSVKILYLEYHSEDDRRAIDSLLSDTHLLVAGKMLLHRGEVTYVAKSAFPSEQARRHHEIKVAF